MQDLNDLYYYVRIIDHGGLAAAGRALGIPKSKLSRRLAALEDSVGMRLVQRSTRQFRVTPVGQTFYEHCKAMLVQAEAALASLETLRAEPCGIVRISCPVALLHAHVGRMLASYMERYPQVQLQVEATNRRVDVVAEGMDIAIRVRPPPLQDSGLVMRVLSDRGQCLVASPALVQRLGRPQVPSDLHGWPGLSLSSSLQTARWELDGPEGARAELHYTPRLATSDMNALREAALAGVGLVQLPLLIVQDDLQSGRLQRLLPDWTLRRQIIHAVFASRRGMLPAVRALVDHLADSYAAFEEE